MNQNQIADRVVELVEELVDLELKGVTAQRDQHRASLGRIRAAAESDADLEKLPGLRDFLLHETKAVSFPSHIAGHMPTEEEG